MKAKVEWIEIEFPEPIQEITWTEYNTLYITDKNGKLYVSHDQGESFKPCKKSLRVILSDVFYGALRSLKHILRQFRQYLARHNIFSDLYDG